MPVYIVRHTTPKVSKEFCYGQSDLDLVEDFTLEFEEVLNKVKLFKFNKVYSSPLKRCVLLAKFLTNENVIINQRLKEISFGEWEMKTWDEIGRTNIDLWANDLINFSPPNGESFKVLCERVKSFFEQISLEENSLVVTHSGVIKALLVLFNDEELQDVLKVKISYGEVLVLDKKRLSFLHDRTL